MIFHWTEKFEEDVDRLYDFLKRAGIDYRARHYKVLDALQDVIEQELTDYPEMGARIDRYAPDHHVRKLLVGDYEVRYLLEGREIWVLRVWHTREFR